ncbi:choline-sulfatase [Dongia deserti]|uniref:choline-sulfatase n=1 Tax=Dongia deserti TaxID=2268030 RepID=UPI000E65C8FE|nr:choline-sulfatase [Dongia deserti]
MPRPDKRPNILLVMFDQMAALSLPVYGHPIVRAPHMTRLAARGTLFANAYCASPLCSPARFAMLTGRLPSRIGAYDNAVELPAGVPTLLHHLRNAGYRTCLSGKMDFTGADQLHGYEERLTTDLSPSDFGWVPDWEHPETVQPWFHTLHSVAEAGPCDHSLSLRYDEEACLQAVHWLHAAADRPDGRPFMLTLSIMHPHDPYQALRPFWDLYQDSEIDMPDLPRRSAKDRNPVERRMHALYDRDEVPISPAQVRRARRAYYAMLSYCDDVLGRLMRALEVGGISDDTMVIVTSDHGDMLGERGLWYKMTFYERAVRVPLLLAGPGIRPRQRIKEAVSHLDLLPTLAALIGARLEHRELAGRDLSPVVKGEAAARVDIRGEYLAEGYDAPVVMVRRGSHKFVHSVTDGSELYDLARDPVELRNLALEPAYAGMVADLLRAAEQHWDFGRLRSDVIASQRQRRMIHAALTTGRIAPWDYAPKTDAADSYYRNYDPTRPDPDRALRRPRR